MKLYVPLTHDEFEGLREIARSERRRPQDQAALLLAERLRLFRRAGALPAEAQANPDRATPAAAIGGAK